MTPIEDLAQSLATAVRYLTRNDRDDLEKAKPSLIKGSVQAKKIRKMVGANQVDESN